MQFSFSYDKKMVIQALRYHFVQRPEVRVLIVLVNVFAIVAAVLFYLKKIRPEPFLLGSFIWVAMMVSFWFIMPRNIYRKAPAFRDDYIVDFGEEGVHLENERGGVDWKWSLFNSYFESPHFFHLYFSSRSFFLIPKEGMSDEMRHDLRGLFRKYISK